MTTPRIEEMVEEFDKRDVEGDFYTVDGNGFNDWESYDIDKVKSFIHHQLQKAHQAGRDEAVGIFNKIVEESEGDIDYIRFQMKPLFVIPQALQDNK